MQTVCALGASWHGPPSNGEAPVLILQAPSMSALQFKRDRSFRYLQFSGTVPCIQLEL